MGMNINVKILSNDNSKLEKIQQLIQEITGKAPTMRVTGGNQTQLQRNAIYAKTKDK